MGMLEDYLKATKENPDRKTVDEATFTDRVSDIALAGAQGVLGIAQGGIGLADEVIGTGSVGRGAESIGIEPTKWSRDLEAIKSPELQADKRAISEAEGFWPTAYAAASEPSTIADALVQSAPAIALTRKMGGAINKRIPAVNPAAAASIAEGSQITGMFAENARFDDPEGVLTPDARAAALLSGGSGALFSYGTGRVAGKLGIEDIDIVKRAQTAVPKAVSRRILEGFASEAVEEMGQSGFETMYDNMINDRPLSEGMDEATAMGGITGGVMGAGTNFRNQVIHQVMTERKTQIEQIQTELKTAEDEITSRHDAEVASGVASSSMLDGAETTHEAAGTIKRDEEFNTLRSDAQARTDEIYTTSNAKLMTAIVDKIVTGDRKFSEEETLFRTENADAIETELQAQRDVTTNREDLADHEKTAALDLDADPTLIRKIAAVAKTSKGFTAELVRRYGRKAKKHAVKLWSLYKRSKFSEEQGSIGLDINAQALEDKKVESAAEMLKVRAQEEIKNDTLSQGTIDEFTEVWRALPRGSKAQKSLEAVGMNYQKALKTLTPVVVETQEPSAAVVQDTASPGPQRVTDASQAVPTAKTDRDPAFDEEGGGGVALEVTPASTEQRQTKLSKVKGETKQESFIADKVTGATKQEAAAMSDRLRRVSDQTREMFKSDEIEVGRKEDGVSEIDENVDVEDGRQFKFRTHKQDLDIKAAGQAGLQTEAITDNEKKFESVRTHGDYISDAESTADKATKEAIASDRELHQMRVGMGIKTDTESFLRKETKKENEKGLKDLKAALKKNFVLNQPSYFPAKIGDPKAGKKQPAATNYVHAIIKALSSEYMVEDIVQYILKEEGISHDGKDIYGAMSKLQSLPESLMDFAEYANTAKQINQDQVEGPINDYTVALSRQVEAALTNISTNFTESEKIENQKAIELLVHDPNMIIDFITEWPRMTDDPARNKAYEKRISDAYDTQFGSHGDPLVKKTISMSQKMIEELHDLSDWVNDTDEQKMVVEFETTGVSYTWRLNDQNQITQVGTKVVPASIQSMAREDRLDQQWKVANENEDLVKSNILSSPRIYKAFFDTVADLVGDRRKDISHILSRSQILKKMGDNGAFAKYELKQNSAGKYTIGENPTEYADRKTAQSALYAAQDALYDKLILNLRVAHDFFEKHTYNEKKIDREVGGQTDKGTFVEDVPGGDPEKKYTITFKEPIEVGGKMVNETVGVSEVTLNAHVRDNEENIDNVVVESVGDRPRRTLTLSEYPNLLSEETDQRSVDDNVPFGTTETYRKHVETMNTTGRRFYEVRFRPTAQGPYSMSMVSDFELKELRREHGAVEIMDTIDLNNGNVKVEMKITKDGAQETIERDIAYVDYLHIKSKEEDISIIGPSETKGIAASSWEYVSTIKELFEAAKDSVNHRTKEPLFKPAAIAPIQKKIDRLDELNAHVKKHGYSPKVMAEVSKLKGEISDQMVGMKAVMLSHQFAAKNFIKMDDIKKAADEAGLQVEELYDAYMRAGAVPYRFVRVLRQLTAENYQRTAEELLSQIEERGVDSYVNQVKFRKGKEGSEKTVEQQKAKRVRVLERLLEHTSAEVSQKTRDEVAEAVRYYESMDLLATAKTDKGATPRLEDVLKIKPIASQTQFESDLVSQGEGLLHVGKLRSRIAQKFYELVTSTFDADLVIVSGNNYTSRYIGEAIDGRPKIVINIRNSGHFSSIFAHELMHHVINKAEPAQYKQFQAAIKSMLDTDTDLNGNSQYDRTVTLKVESLGPVNEVQRESFTKQVREELEAELFAKMSTSPQFYETLAKTFTGQKLAATLITRLMKNAESVNVAMNQTQDGYALENRLLIGDESLSDLHDLFSTLIGKVAVEDGEVQSAGTKYLTVFGPATTAELEGYLKTPKKWLKGIWSKIFKPGTKDYRDMMTNIENILKGMMIGIKDFKWKAVFADFLADPIHVDLMNKLVFSPGLRVKELRETVVRDHKAAFDGMSNEELEIMHDEIVRQGLDFTQEEDVQTARELGYSEKVIDAYKAYAEVSNDIYEQLKKIYPDLEYRPSHYGQSIRWRYPTESKHYDNSNWNVDPSKSALKGDESWKLEKAEDQTTADILEKGMLYDTIDPSELFLNYVNETQKLISFHAVMKEGIWRTDSTGKQPVKIFTSEEDAKKSGYIKINDNAMKIFETLELDLGYQIRVNDELNKDDDGSIHIFKNQELAELEASGIEGAVVEPVSPGKKVMAAGFEIYNKDSGEVVRTFPLEADAKHFFDSVELQNPDVKFTLRKAKATPAEVQTGQIYLGKDMGHMMNTYLAKDKIRSTRLGSGMMNLKNVMTGLEFAFSMFHAITIGQELAASYLSWGWKKRKIRGKIGFSKAPEESKQLVLLVEAAFRDPEMAKKPAFQKKVDELLGTNGADILEVAKQYFLVGGMLHQDKSLQSSLYKFGEMKYATKERGIEIVNGEIVFTNATKLKDMPSKPIDIGKAMGQSIKKAFDDQMAREPDKKVKALAKTLNFAAFQSTSAWLMEDLIPKVKMATFIREYTNGLEKHAQEIASGAMTKGHVAHMTMKFVEDRFGEVNWQNQWMDPTAKTTLQFLFRSFTWFTGSWKALSKAGIDIGKWGWFKAKDAGQAEGDKTNYELTEKGQWGITALFAHVATVMMVKVAYGIMVGTGLDDDEVEDEDTPFLTEMLFPRIDPGDPRARVSIPSYITEGYKIMRHLGIIGNEAEPTKMISGRTSSIIGKTMEALYHGEDWRGVKVRDPNDGFAGQAFDTLAHILWTPPISVSTIKKNITTRGFSAKGIGLGLLGMTDAPAAAKRSEATNKAYALTREEFKGASKTEEEMEIRDDMRRAMYKLQRGDRKEIDQMLKDGTVSRSQYKRELKKLPRIMNRKNPLFISELNRAVKRLSIEATIEVWEHMTEDEKKNSRRIIRQKYSNLVKRKDKPAKRIKEIRLKMKEVGINK